MEEIGGYTFFINKATEQELERHLIENSESEAFTKFVKESGYANKIYSFAERFEMWKDDCLIGIIAAYFNKETNVVFITHVRVNDEHKKKGIAKFLLEKVIEKAEAENYGSIELEVFKDNFAAQGLYNKYGFVIASFNEENKKYYMRKEM